jgi:1-acyl-sn-glycerol-3-phosphate acyltransferase
MLVAGNHVSYLDPWAHGYFVVEAGRRPRFLAKQELFDNWFTGMVLRGAGQIPVRRGGGDRRAVEQAAAALRAGEVVVVYPEGTSQSSPPDFTPGTGKTGVARLAIGTGTPILPVASWGGQWVWRHSGRQSLKFGRPIWVVAGAPITPDSDDPSDAEAARKLTAAVMHDLAMLVRSLRERYPERWTPRVG